MAESKQTISLCMIVRDEERFIAQCLTSIKDYVDEIIVVDTGSTDSTVEIASGYGARIYPYRWVEDFSAARNHSIDQATGKWILVLDADETVAARDASQLGALVEDARVFGFKLRQRTYLRNANYVCALPNPKDYSEGREYSNCVDVDVIRLFRNVERIRYQGRVHELVEPAFVAHQLAFESSNIVLHHFGKVGEALRLEAKKALYLALGRRKVQDDSQDHMARFELGVQLYELERYAESIPYFEAAFKLNPASDLALLYIAKAHHISGNTDEAKLYFQKCLKRGPDNDKVLFDYANFVRDQGRFRSSLRLYQRTLLINPRHSLALFNTGVVYIRLGEVQRGLEWIRKALRINPDNISFYENLGRLPFTGASLEEAARLIEEFLERSPETARCHAVLGEMRFQLKQYDKALESAERALAIEPGLFGSALVKANAQFILGRLSDAEESYRAVLLLVSDNLDSMMNLAAIAEHRQDYALAKSWYRRLLASSPDHPQALKRYVVAQARGGADADSWSALERACSANSGDLQCLLLVGGLLERSEKTELAQALYGLARQEHPEWAAIVDPRLQRLELMHRAPVPASSIQR